MATPPLEDGQHVRAYQMPQKKQRRSDPIPFAYYHFQITDWDMSYSFSANVPKYEDSRFSDYRHLLIRGAVLRPRKMGVETAELWFFPNIARGDFEPKHDQPPPPGVGTLNIHGAKSEGLRLVGYLSMPEDALALVVQMLIAGRYKFALMNGGTMRWRKCFIRGYEFTAEHDEGDFPDDE